MRIDEKPVTRAHMAIRYFGSGNATRRPRVAAALAAAFTTVGLAVAPCAAADSVDSLRAAIAATRGTACGPLRPDPTIDRVAEKVNQSTDDWINNTTRAVPETDALPPLKDSGYDASKAAILSSAAKDDGNAVKALLLQGFAKIPDCSYSSFGVAATYNAKKEMILMTAVLAG